MKLESTREISIIKERITGERESITKELEIMEVLNRRKGEHIETLKSDLKSATQVICNPRLKHKVYTRLKDATRDASTARGARTLDPAPRSEPKALSAIHRTRPPRRARYSSMDHRYTDEKF